jgi:outer membrane protein TolC
MKRILFLLFVVVIPALFGQDINFSPETRIISLDAAVDMALRNNLGLESQRITNATNKRKSDYAWNVFVPTIDLRGTLMTNNTATTMSVPGYVPLNPFIPGLPAGTPTILGINPLATTSTEMHPWNISAALSFQLTFNYGLFEGMNKTKLDYQGGLITYEKAKAQLEQNVRKSYYQMLLLQENIALLRENAKAADDRVKTAQTNYNAGLIPELNLLQAQVAAVNMKPTIDQAENGLKLSMAQFAMYLGLPYDTPFELIAIATEASFIPLDVQSLIKQASTGKPDIQELRHQIATLESTRKQTFYQLYTPSLALSWSLSPTLVDVWNTNWFSDNWHDSGSFSLTLSFRLNSLFPFDANNQSLKTIDDNLRSMNIGLAQSIRGTEIEVYNTVLSLQKIQATIEAQTQSVNLAQRSYDLTSQAYAAGYSDLMEVQNAELELHKARIGVLEQNFNYLSGLIDLEYSMGVPFGTLSVGGF